MDPERDGPRFRLPLDLREFFAGVDAEAFMSQINAMAESGSQEELDQTTREAAQAIPLLRDILRKKKQAEEEFDLQEAKLWLGVALPLIACYRIAEDRGYNWGTPQPPPPPKDGEP
jgi:hypothetical protein